MNICHHLLISVCLLLVINIDESIVDSKNIIIEILKKCIKKANEDTSEPIPDDSSGKFEGGKYYFNTTGIEFPKKNESENSSEECGYEECSCEENQSVNSNEEIENKNSNGKRESKNSSEQSGSKNSNEESGNTSSNEESANTNPNKANKIKNSNEKNKIKNSNEKNKIKNCNEVNKGKKCNENIIVNKCNGENKVENSNEANLIENNKEENEIKHFNEGSEIENSIEKVEIKPFYYWSYLSSIDKFHKAKPHEYPYHVAFIWNLDGQLLCQGALIRTGWVVTSASCISRYEFHTSGINALVGATSLDDESAISYGLSKIFYYPEFIPEDGSNDFALVMLDREVIMHSKEEWQTLFMQHLPFKKRCQFSTFVGNTLYGKSVDYVLQENCDVTEVEDQVLPYFCASIGRQLIRITQSTTLGSPLVCSGIVYGIKSKYTFFTSVDNLDVWLDDTISEEVGSAE